ncbi:MAG TPA: DUF6587 family protein [Albitalea sp.]|nr:DUF6587 family protein [Albitalea sp.]
MDLQSFVVALIVMGCSAYAAWSLMPAAARRAIATTVLRLSLPEFLAKPFAKALKPASGCGGCDSCGDEAAKPAAMQTVKFHPRIRPSSRSR